METASDTEARVERPYTYTGGEGVEPEQLGQCTSSCDPPDPFNGHKNIWGSSMVGLGTVLFSYYRHRKAVFVPWQRMS